MKLAHQENYTAEGRLSHTNEEDALYVACAIVHNDVHVNVTHVPMINIPMCDESIVSCLVHTHTHIYIYIYLCAEQYKTSSQVDWEERQTTH
jgi:hypothetical protein